MKVTVHENSCLKDELSLLKQTLELFTVRKQEFPKFDSKINAEEMIKSPIFFEIGKFLEIKDFLNFQQVNKSIFFGSSLDTKLISLITKSVHKKLKLQINKLESQLKFNRNKYEEIPDDYLKSSILKFIYQDFKIGDLMPPILKKSQMLIDKDVFNFKEEASNSQGFIGINEKNNENDLNLEKEQNNKETAFEELANRNSLKNEEISENLGKNEEKKNFFQKLFVKLNNKHENPKNEEKMAEIVKEKRKISEKINLEQIAKKFKSLVTLNDFSINQEFLKMFEKESNVFKNKVNLLIFIL